MWAQRVFILRGVSVLRGLAGKGFFLRQGAVISGWARKGVCTQGGRHRRRGSALGDWAGGLFVLREVVYTWQGGLYQGGI